MVVHRNICLNYHASVHYVLEVRSQQSACSTPVYGAEMRGYHFLNIRICLRKEI